MQRTQAQMNTFQASINKSMAGIGKALKIGLGYLSIRAIANFTKATTEIASDLTEVQNVVDVVFGSMAKDINDFADISIEQFGLSALSAKKYASSMGAMLKSSGIAGEAVRDMALDLTKLSADMASFYNLDNEEMFRKIMSGMSGMSTPLKELGINMNIANLEAFALAQGINKTWQQMSQAEQTMIRYKYLLSVTGDAQGDFARNAHTWANQTKILSQQFEILKGTIGAGFINALMPVVKLLNALIRRMQVAAEYFKAFTRLIFGDAEASSQGGVALENMADNLGDVEEGFGAVGKAGKKAAKDIKNSVAGFDELNILMDKAGGGAGALADELGDIGGVGSIDLGDIGKSNSIDLAVESIENRFKESFSKIFKNIDFSLTKEAFNNLKKSLEPLKPFAETALADMFQKLVLPVGEWTMNEGVPRFLNALADGFNSINWEGINASLRTLWEALAPFAINVGEGLLWFWENVLVPLGAWTMSNVVPFFLEILANAITIVNNVIEALKPLGKWLWDNFLQPLASWTGGIIVNVLEMLSDVLKTIGDWIKNHQSVIENLVIIVGSFAAAWGLVNAAITVWNATIGVWNALGAVATTVTSAFGAAVAFLTSPIVLVTAAIGALIAIIVLLIRNWDTVKETATKCWEGIKQAWNTACEWFENNITGPVKEAFSTSWESIKNIWNKAGSFFSGIWNNIKKAFRHVADWFKNTFSEAWQKVKDVFSTGGKIFEGIKEGIANTFKNVVNSIIGGINKVIALPFNTINGLLNKIRNIEILGIRPFANFWRENPLTVPQIPKLARGGIVDSPTIAMIGEAGKEAVIPLENTSFITTFAKTIANEISKIIGTQRTTDSSNVELVLRVGEMEFGRIAIRAINEVQRATGTTLLIV